MNFTNVKECNKIFYLQLTKYTQIENIEVI